MSARCGIPALVATATAVLSGCISAPLAPPAAAPVAATAAAPAGPMTLPQFLGLAPVCNAVGKHAKHKLAFIGKHFPCVEPKPPLLPLSDPANMASAVPAIAAAAEIKAEEDMAPQKIKALKYLATIGCGGCYPGVEEAFLAGLDDCTEEVRFEAAKAIHATAGTPCIHCNNKACCSPKIRKRLTEIAFGGSPCPSEPSPRVRRMARIALKTCGAPAPLEFAPPAPTEVIPEGPTVAPEEVPAPPEPSASTRTIPTGVALTDLPAPTTAGAIAAMTSKHRADADATVANIVPPFDQNIAHAAVAATATAASDEVASDEVASGGADGTLDGSPGLDRVTDAELDRYYTAFRDRYRVVDQVRWESVSVSCEEFDSQDDAVAVMLYVQQLARGETPEPPAAFEPDKIDAHRHDWTKREEIASPPVAQALFTQAVGSISDVMTDGERLILVRVVERRLGEPAPLATIADRVRADLLADRSVSALVSDDTPHPSQPADEKPKSRDPVEAPIPSGTFPVESPNISPANPTPTERVTPERAVDETESVAEPPERLEPAEPVASSEPDVVAAIHEHEEGLTSTTPEWAIWSPPNDVEQQSLEIRAAVVELESLSGSPATAPVVPDVLSLRAGMASP